MNRVAKLIAELQRCFAIDLRALAAFRMGLALILLGDLWLRFGSLRAHYTDRGVLPLAEVDGLFLVSPWHWSLHGLGGGESFQTALFALAVIAACSLLLGLWTRVAVCLSWVLLCSVQARNPMLLYGADHLLRMLLFWSLFLPLGARCSMDARRSSFAPAGPCSSMGSLAVLVQVSLLYLFSGIFKLNDAWLAGNALESSLRMAMFAKPLASTLVESGWSGAALAPLIPWLEIGCGLLLVLPLRSFALRGLALVMLLFFHLSVQCVLETGIYQAVAVVALLLFLPAGFWDRVSGLGRGGVPEDGESASCERVEVDPLKGHGSSWIGDAKSTLIALLLIYAVAWNVASVGARSYAREHLADWLREHEGGPFRYRLLLPGYDVERRLGVLGWIGRAAHLHQQWNMFEEGGGTLDGWHVVIGTTGEGEQISLLEGGASPPTPLHLEPRQAARLYPDTRWRVLFKYMLQAEPARARFATTLAAEWNHDHPEHRIESLKLLYVQEDALGDEGTPTVTTWFDGALDTQ